MAFCSKCGGKLASDDEFCQKCGTKTKGQSLLSDKVTSTIVNKRLPLWSLIITLTGTFFLAVMPILHYIFGVKLIGELDAFVLFGTFLLGIFGGILLFYQLSNKIRGYSMIIPISLIINLVITVILFTNVIGKTEGLLLLAFTNLVIFILSITVIIWQKSK